MPSKNRVKVYVENGIYHVYNRGVDKQEIFRDDQDYLVFLYLLKYYLSPITLETPHPLLETAASTLVRPRPLANLEKELELLAFCLMPNHFHLLVRQKSLEGMTRLLRRVSTTYALYFNRKYRRVGYLFQGHYKAALVDTDIYLLHVSRYIHLNPLELTRSDLVSYQYSSYPYYLGLRTAVWLRPNLVLGFFEQDKKAVLIKQPSSYKDFVEEYFQDSHEAIGDLALD